MVKPKDLSLYDDPDANAVYQYIPYQPNKVEQQVSKARIYIWKYIDPIQSTTTKIRNKYAIAKTHTENMIHSVQEDPGVIPRVSLIAVAGLGGIVAGFRGGVIRKAFYGSIAATATASLCYPNQAVDITTSGYNELKKKLTELRNYSSISLGKDTIKKPSAPLLEDENSTAKPHNIILEPAKSKGNITVGEDMKDYGQGKAEDAAMYSKRDT